VAAQELSYPFLGDAESPTDLAIGKTSRVERREALRTWSGGGTHGGNIVPRQG